MKTISTPLSSSALACRPPTTASELRASVLDCGGKRSATPLSDAPHATETRRRRCALPAHCKRFATALALLLLSTLIYQPSIAHAQGTAFTYQGFLTDQGGPANGAYDLTFTLFNAASGGSTVGASNVVNDLGVTNGLFTVTLDFGASFPGADRWLEIAVRPGNSTGAYTNVTRASPSPPRRMRSSRAASVRRA